MINPEDASLHEPSSNDPHWAETNFFGFYVPELNMNCGVYALFRTNLNVGLSTIHLCSRRAKAHWEAEYCDLQMHLPMGTDFDLCNYQLANGLSVKCTTPNMDWEVDYDDGEGTEIHFQYRSLMQPFDINDPKQDPMVAAAAEGSDFQWGTAYSGHFDQTGVFNGTIVLRGREIPFSCVSTMDHSWGVRAERHAHSMSWLHAHFSEDYAIHAIFDFDPHELGELRLTHGYVLDSGKVLGLKSGRGRTIRNNYFPEVKLLELQDESDKRYSLRGVAVTSFPWQAWPGVVGFNALMDWVDQEGNEGKGETQDFMGVSTLTSLGV